MKVGYKIVLIDQYNYQDHLDTFIIPRGTVGEIINTPNEQIEFTRQEIILVRFDLPNSIGRPMDVSLYDPLGEIYEEVA